MECKKSIHAMLVRSVEPLTILLCVCELSFVVWVGFPERSRGTREGAKNPRNNVRPYDRRRIKAVSFEIHGVRFLWCVAPRKSATPSRLLLQGVYIA